MPNLHSPYLGAVVAGLRQQTLRPLEVIVVGQDRYELARDDGWLRVFPTPRPVPPAVATNIAIAYAHGEVLAFLDSDCVPAPDWLERLMAHQLAGRVAVGGSIGFQQQSYWQRCDNIACLGAFMQTAPAGERPYLLSGNMALHRAVISRAGFFDESFRQAAGEDAELGLRIRSTGISLYFDPTAVVYHHTDRATANAVWRHMRGFGVQWPKIARRHRSQLPASLWQLLYRAAPPLGMAAVPLVALRDLYHFYGGQPAMLRDHWPTLPGVFWGRLGWYAGLMAATHSNEKV